MWQGVRPEGAVKPKPTAGLPNYPSVSAEELGNGAGFGLRQENEQFIFICLFIPFMHLGIVD